MTGRIPAFRRPCARDELMEAHLSRSLALDLMGRGISGEDADALAANTVELYLWIDWESRPPEPAALLGFYSLGELAALYGALAEHRAGTLDYAENESYGMEGAS